MQKAKLIAKNVDEYLKRLPDDQRDVLQKLREVIRTTAPKAEEMISYHIPGYKYHGPLVFFAAYKKHCSLFAVNKNMQHIFEKELKPYSKTGSTIHFTPENPLPAALVKKIIKTRMKENEGRSLIKKPSRNGKK